MKILIFLTLSLFSQLTLAETLYCLAIEHRQLPEPEEFKVTEWNFPIDEAGEVLELVLSPTFPGYSFDFSYSKERDYLSVKIHMSKQPLFRTQATSTVPSKDPVASMTLAETVAKSTNDVQERVSIDLACSLEPEALKKFKPRK